MRRCWKILGTAVLALAVLAGGVWGLLGWNEAANSRLHVTRYTFRHPDVPENFDGYRILFLSDMHDAPFGEQALEIIRETEPDLLLFGGDLVQLPGWSVEEAAAIARGVGGSIPMYAVSGNHESQNEAYWEMVSYLWDEGVTWLEDDSVWLEKDGQGICLIGLKDCGHNDPVDEETLEEMVWTTQELCPEDDSAFVMLLAHRANLYPALKDTGVDLILSGHLHGGVVRLPFVGGLVGHENGELTLFPRYAYGFYQEGEAAMIVSGGCDWNPEKKRWFNPPELVLVTLEQGEAEVP